MTSTATAAQGEGLTIVSDVLGVLTIEARDVVRFPAGLYGFPECRTFALLPTPREGLYWLQSTDYTALSFLLADPFLYFPGFHIELDDADISRLGTTDPQDILVLAIVTMPARAGAPCTANLHAPVLCNLRERHGHQSIRSEDGFDMRAPFDLESLPGDAPAAAGA
jgi:flagellar assembly factor FliW